MMHPVHVRCHHHQPQDAVDPQGDVEIAVIEHGRAVEQDLEYDDRHGGCTQDRNGRRLDAHGDDDLDGMKAGAGGEIVIQIRMVHHVEPPQQGNGVEHQMLKVYNEIKQNHRQDDFDPDGPVHIVKHAPPLPSDPHRNPQSACRNEHPQNHGIDDHNTDIREPATCLGCGQGSSRDGEF